MFNPDPKPERQPKKRYKKIRPKSKKMNAVLKAYSINRNIFLEENPRCGVCKLAKATEVHHMRGRGVNLNTMQFWLQICRPCHRWVTDNPHEAIEKGYSLYRLQQ